MGLRASFHARGYRRSIRIGLLISAVLHALVAIFVSGQFYVGTRSFRPVELPPRPTVGLEVIEISDIEAESAAEEVLELPPEDRDGVSRTPSGCGPGREIRACGRTSRTGLYPNIWRTASPGLRV